MIKPDNNHYVNRICCLLESVALNWKWNVSHCIGCILTWCTQRTQLALNSWRNPLIPHFLRFTDESGNCDNLSNFLLIPLHLHLVLIPHNGYICTWFQCLNMVFMVLDVWWNVVALLVTIFISTWRKMDEEKQFYFVQYVGWIIQ